MDFFIYFKLNNYIINLKKDGPILIEFEKSFKKNFEN